MSATPAVRASARRKLFAPTPIVSDTTHSSATTVAALADSAGQVEAADGSVDNDAALAAALTLAESRRSYSLRRRVAAPSTTTIAAVAASSARTSPRNTSDGQQQRRGVASATKRSRANSSSTALEVGSDSGLGSHFSHDTASSSSDHDSDVFTAQPTSKSKPKPRANPTSSSASKRTRKTVKTESSTRSTPSRSRTKTEPTSPKKAASSPFNVSPRKSTKKPIKVNLEPHQAHPAPENWETVYALLAKQRTKIVAPVDTMGCEENGREHRRADSWRKSESPQEAAKRERLATLVSLMLSSQTKDPVTAEAVYNLQRTLPNGLCLQSLLDAHDETISNCIAKVGFWRRKTGYLKSAARILSTDFDGDVPRTVDELCSLPGVGPKMAFLALSSMGIQIGIGVDTHVHRLTNRLGWHSTKTPEETRLNLQSWLPHHLHGKINRLLVGFGQVVCVPVGPRCDLCSVGQAGLCPSYREVDAKTALKRVKVEMLQSDDDEVEAKENWVKLKKQPQSPDAKLKVQVEIQAPDGKGALQVADLTASSYDDGVRVKQEYDESVEVASVEKALEW